MFSQGVYGVWTQKYLKKFALLPQNPIILGLLLHAGGLLRVKVVAGVLDFLEFTGIVLCGLPSGPGNLLLPIFCGRFIETEAYVQLFMLPKNPHSPFLGAYILLADTKYSFPTNGPL